MGSAIRSLAVRYAGDMLAVGGLAVLLHDVLSHPPAARAMLLADALIVVAGLLTRAVASVAKPEAPPLGLGVLTAGCLAAAGIGGRPVLGVVGGLAVAVVAPHLVTPRRAAAWVAVATLLAVPMVLADPAVGAGAAAALVAAGILGIVLAVRLRRSASRDLVELEMALDLERHRVAQLTAIVGQEQGKERRLERRAMLRGTLARRLGTIEAVAHVLARELEAALAKRSPQPLEAAAARGVQWADQLSRIAAGGKAREQQTTLSQIWPRVQSLAAVSVLPTHTVRTSFPALMPPVVGSGEAWAQVLLALVENALDSMPNGGVVDVRQEVSARPAFARISVSDHGPGMTQDEMARVLRLDPLSHGETLGLAMVIAVVEGLGGEFTIESAPGAGTRIELEVPFAAEAVVGEEMARLEGRVLLADDDEDVRRVTARMLATLGMEVVQADSGAVARSLLASAARGHFRAAILDVVMPGTPIEDIIVGMRQREPGFPVLLISGYDTMQMVDAIIALGGIRFLRKPFRRHDLYQALRDLFSVEPPPDAAAPPG
jgi:signal transduction histidine kinase/ActR/RegA family two-component response regulator